MRARSFYIFGDSVCFGQYVSIHKTWGSLLSAALEQDEQFSDVVTQVTAVNGETSTQALGRIAYSVLHHRPTVVWAQFGLNDANYWSTDKGKPRVEPDEFVNNMLSIAHQCLINGTSSVILATNHPVSKEIPHMHKDAYRDNARLYNSVLRVAIASTKHPGIQLLDMESTFRSQETPNGHLLADGVHLSEVGHIHYFAHSCDFVKATLGVVA